MMYLSIILCFLCFGVIEFLAYVNSSFSLSFWEISATITSNIFFCLPFPCLPTDTPIHDYYMWNHLKLFHGSLMLFSFPSVIHFLCVWIWIVSIATTSNSLIFSYALSHLPLFPSGIIFISDTLFFISRNSVVSFYIFHVSNEQGNSSFNFLRTWNPINAF